MQPPLPDPLPTINKAACALLLCSSDEKRQSIRSQSSLVTKIFGYTILLLHVIHLPEPDTIGRQRQDGDDSVIPLSCTRPTSALALSPSSPSAPPVQNIHPPHDCKDLLPLSLSLSKEIEASLGTPPGTCPGPAAAAAASICNMYIEVETLWCHAPYFPVKAVVGRPLYLLFCC